MSKLVIKRLFNPIYLIVLFPLAVYGQDTSNVKSDIYYSISKFNSDTLIAGRFLAAGEEFVNKQKLDSARIEFQKAADIFEKIPLEKRDSSAWYNQSNAYYWIGYLSYSLANYKKTEIYLNKCIDVLKNQLGGKEEDLSFVYNKISGVYNRTGDPYKAFQYLQRSFQIRLKTMEEDNQYVAFGYYNMGLGYYNIGDFDQAISHYQKSIELILKYNRNRMHLVIYSYTAIGYIHLLEKNYEESFSYLNKGLKTGIEVFGDGDKLLLDVYANLGLLYLNTHDLEKATVHLKKASSISEQVRGFYHPKTAYLNNLIGEVHFRQGEFEEALNYHQIALHALSLNFSEKNIFSNPTPEMFTSDAYAIVGLIIKAYTLETYYLKQKQDIELLKLSLNTYDLALQLFKERRRDFRSILAKINLNKRFISFMEGGLWVSLKLYNLTGEEFYLEQAFSFMEENKAQILLESIKDIKMRDFIDHIPSETLTEEDKIKFQIAEIEKGIFVEKSKDSTVIDLQKILLDQKEIFKLTQAHDSLIKSLKLQHPDYFRLRYPVKTISIKEIQAHLPHEKTAFIEYFMGDSSLYIITITKDQVTSLQKELPSDFLNQVQRTIELLSKSQLSQDDPREWKKDFDQFTKDSHELYKFLLEDVVKKKEVKNLVIIPDGILGYLPFQILLTTNQTGQGINFRHAPYIFHQYDIRYDYSGSLLLEKQEKNNSTKTFLGFAPSYSGESFFASRGEDSLLLSTVFNASYRDGLGNLKYTKEEIQGILPPNGKAMIGSRATEFFFKELSPNYRILHLAMHALTNDEEPLYSQLVFSEETDSTEDGKLHAYELYNMNLNAELAVLSACETGAGKLQRGEGIMSLSRAFKYAGCPNIVMSLWKANDKTTKDIMVGFYNNLKAGQGKSEALNNAKKDFLKNCDQQYTHPFYWATFVLIGDNEPIEFNSGIFSGGWIWILGIVLLSFIVWQFRQRF